MKRPKHLEGSFDIAPIDPKRLWGVAQSDAPREWVFLGDKWKIRLRPGRKTRATPNTKLRRAHKRSKSGLPFKVWLRQRKPIMQVHK